MFSESVVQLDTNRFTLFNRLLSRDFRNTFHRKKSLQTHLDSLYSHYVNVMNMLKSFFF